MKKIIPCALVCFSSLSFGQQKDVENVPYFAAVIVKDVSVSSKWYQDVFHLDVKERMGDDKTDYKVFILEGETFVLELLQLKNSQDPRELLKSKPSDARIQGHFKIGFKVADFETCLAKLRGQKVDVSQVYTDSKTKKRNMLIRDPNGNLLQIFE